MTSCTPYGVHIQVFSAVLMALCWQMGEIQCKIAHNIKPQRLAIEAFSRTASGLCVEATDASSYNEPL